MDKVNRINGFAIPVAIGIVFFLYIFGYQPLNVYKYEWLSRGDALQNYLGWQFFRQAPWSFPVIGMSSGYGMDVGSSIVFSDSNPLLAIISKIFSPLLPETFQYFGIWLLACCVLQSFFLWKIISLLTKSDAIKFFSVILMMFNPAWINRVGHINLMGHFLVLAAIYLVISNNERRRTFKWSSLMMIAFAVHFYLALMVSIIWGANVFSRLVTRKSSFKCAVRESAIVLSLSIATMYVVGYFTVGSVAPNGEFGVYHNNLLSFLISNGWSHFFNFHIFGVSTFESFNFWGTGLLIALIAGLSGVIKTLKITKINEVTLTYFLFIPLFLMLATTNVIAFGQHQFVIKLPYQIVNALSVARASARFFWPITYCAMILILAGVLASFSKRNALIIIMAASVIQVYDTSAGYRKESFYFFKKTEDSFVLNNEFWSNISGNYSYLRYVPFHNQDSHWSQLSLVAERNRIPTDAVYLARFNDKKSNEMNKSVLTDLASGEYDSRAVYVIRDDLVDKVSLRDGDKIFRIDGLNVLAPAMQSCVRCAEVKRNVKNDAYVFTRDWLSRQSLGEWNDGFETTILVQSQSENVHLKIGYKVFTPRQAKQQRLIFMVNGKVIKEVMAHMDGEVELSWANEYGIHSSVLTIETPDAIEPRSIGMNDDPRLISFGINSISFKKISQEAM